MTQSRNSDRPHLHVALATCSDLPDWEVDDRPLVAALKARGAAVSQPAWDDPAVDWAGFDGCLIRTTWDYMERQSEYVDWAERVAAVTPLLNPPGVVRWNTDKTYLRDLERAGIPGIPTVWLPRRAATGDPVDVAALLAERGWSRAFLKPVVGATARETLRFDADEEGIELAQAHVDRLLPRESLMLQPYLERVETDGERSAIFLEDGTGRLALSHAVVKRPVAGDYRVQDDFGATDEPVTLEPQEAEVAQAAVARVERPGLWRGEPEERLLYARVDLLRGNAGHEGAVFVTELEVVEPSLFFRHAPDAAVVLAEGFVRRIHR